MRSRDQKVEIIARVPLFSALAKRELQGLARMMDEVDVREGTALTREGAPGGEFFIVLDGTVRVEQGGRAVRELGPGDFLGEIALILHRPRTATAVATSPARLLVLAPREFRSVLEVHPSVESKILRALAERVADHDPAAAM